MARVIPCLLLSGRGLVKTVRFRNPVYVGDPRNAVKIFNEREVDELVLLDILASRENRPPSFALIRDIVSEAFMPVAYGGGISTISQARELFSLGVEKIVINSAAATNPLFIQEAASVFGSQSVMLSLDVKRDVKHSSIGDPRMYTHGGIARAPFAPLEFARDMQARGVGEILLNSIDRDGTGDGFDLDIIRTISAGVSIPIIACGGAGRLEHLRQAIDSGASAVAAGSLFVFQGKYRAVLINYPDKPVLDSLFS